MSGECDVPGVKDSLDLCDVAGEPVVRILFLQSTGLMAVIGKFAYQVCCSCNCDRISSNESRTSETIRGRCVCGEPHVSGEASIADNTGNILSGGWLATGVYVLIYISVCRLLAAID